jgi:uncharacterized phage-associated protein
MVFFHILRKISPISVSDRWYWAKKQQKGGKRHMYRALDVSRHIFKRCRDTGTVITNRKLQKLLYFIQGDFLAGTGEPCFFEELEAWEWGPVVPEVYRRYQPFGDKHIPYLGLGDAAGITIRDMDRMDTVIDRYSPYSDSTLEQMVFAEGPWLWNYSDQEAKCIPRQELYEWFIKQPEEVWRRQKSLNPETGNRFLGKVINVQIAPPESKYESKYEKNYATDNFSDRTAES